MQVLYVMYVAMYALYVIRYVNASMYMRTYLNCGATCFWITSSAKLLMAYGHTYKHIIHIKRCKHLYVLAKISNIFLSRGNGND